jgi:transcriptional regulator with XRE-family HTH domain
MSKATNNLDYYMKLRGMTGAQLANDSGVSTSAISRFLSGEREPDTVARRIAAVLGATASDVFPWLDDSPERPESSDD